MLQIFFLTLPDLIQSIGGIGDQLPEENFFVGVECVDDQTHKLSNLSLESEGFNIVSHLGVCNYSGKGTSEQNLQQFAIISDEDIRDVPAML